MPANEQDGAQPHEKQTAGGQSSGQPGGAGGARPERLQSARGKAPIPVRRSRGRPGNPARPDSQPRSRPPPKIRSDRDSSQAAPAERESPARTVQIVQVQFKGVRTDYFTWRGDAGVKTNEYIIVEADRGQDLGWVKRAEDAEQHSCEGGCDHVEDRPVVLPPRRVYRRAAPADLERHFKLTEDEADIRNRTRSLVRRHKLKMKVSEAEWQWDRNKLTVFFTAEKRVDFRALVKEMARTFKTRIELRQIGVRDEAKRLGGIGRCGRELCCRLWLPEIEPVTLQLAKDQGLSLNPAQISGACGRLMSCLRYEHEMYEQARKRFPRVGKRLRTNRGEEEVTEWDLFRETISLKGPDGETRTVALEDLKAETKKRRAQARTQPRPR
ncbi:MAG: regulatory iron-sulfur-containing complex subunit RicT [Gemmatimonadota bacterium]